MGIGGWSVGIGWWSVNIGWWKLLCLIKCGYFLKCTFGYCSMGNCLIKYGYCLMKCVYLLKIKFGYCNVWWSISILCYHLLEVKVTDSLQAETAVEVWHYYFVYTFNEVKICCQKSNTETCQKVMKRTAGETKQGNIKGKLR